MKNLTAFLLQMIFVLVFGVAALAQFSTPQIIGDTIGESDLPHIASDGSDVYLAWRGDAFVNGVAETQVLFRRSVDSGLNWRETLNLSKILEDGMLTSTPPDTNIPFRSPTDLDLAVSASNVYIVWVQAQFSATATLNGNSKIFGVVSNDGGLSFNTINGFTATPTGAPASFEHVRDTDAKGEARCPAIATSGNNVHIAWLDNRIISGGTTTIGAFNVFYSMSMDGGNNFTSVQTLSSVMAQEEAFCPDIAVSGGSVVVAWPETTTTGGTTFETEIQYRTSTDSGQTFFATATPVIDEVDDGNIVGLQLVAEGNVFLAAWVEEGNTESTVKTAYSLDHGLNFTTNNNNNVIPNDITRYPDLSLKDGTAWLVLSQEDDAESNILIFRSDDGGQTFTQVETISSTTDTTNSIQPVVTAFYGRVHVAWMDDGGGTQRKYKIHYRSNLPNSTADPRQISEDLGISDMPSIAVEGSNVYVVYRSDNGGGGAASRQILFRRSINFGVTFETALPLSTADCMSLGTPPPSTPACFSEVRNPEVAARGDFVMVVWQERTCSTCTFDIMIAYSNDGGASFEQHTAPVGNNSSLNISKLLDLTTDTTDDGCEFSTSTDGEFRLERNDISPAVALSDNFFYLVWSYDHPTRGYQVMYARWTLSTFFGATAALTRNVICPSDTTTMADEQTRFSQLSSSTTTTGNLRNALEPSISVKGTRVDVVWFQNRTTTTTGGPHGVFLASNGSRGDFATTFTPTEVTLNFTNLNITSSTVGNIECPTVVTHNNKRYIAWSLNIAGTFQVVLHISDLGTTTTLTNATAALITQGTTHSRCPNLAAGNSTVYLSWFGRTSGAASFDVFAIQNPTTSGGNATPGNISNTAGDSEFQDLALDDNDRLFAVWLDKTSGKPEIFFEGGIQLASTARVASAASVAPQPQPTFQVTQLGMHSFTVHILGVDVVSVRLEVFSLSGERVVKQEADGNQLRFEPFDANGRPLANGVYLYLVSGQKADGTVVRSDIRKLVILR